MLSWFKRWLLWLLPTRKKKIIYSKEKKGGAEESPEDDRDYEFTHKPSSQELPIKFSLRSKVSRIENQGSYNSCVGCSISNILEPFAMMISWTQ